MIFTRSLRGLWSYNTRNLRLIPFFRFWDQLYMTEPPNSSELDTVSVESTAIYLFMLWRWPVPSRNWRHWWNNIPTMSRRPHNVTWFEWQDETRIGCHFFKTHTSLLLAANQEMYTFLTMNLDLWPACSPLEILSLHTRMLVWLDHSPFFWMTFTLVNVYVDLVVFTRIAGTS